MIEQLKWEVLVSVKLRKFVCENIYLSVILYKNVKVGQTEVIIGRISESNTNFEDDKH